MDYKTPWLIFWNINCAEGDFLGLNKDGVVVATEPMRWRTRGETDRRNILERKMQRQSSRVKELISLGSLQALQAPPPTSSCFPILSSFLRSVTLLIFMCQVFSLEPCMQVKHVCFLSERKTSAK